jgi:lipopolysaccharide biosynthesis glycosyltransferase
LCPADGTVLLLDADTICNGSLKELLSVDLNNRVLAAAPSSKPETVRLNLALNRPKFNAGVLFINLDQWERKNIEQRAREYIKKEKPKLNDQDAINILLNKKETTKYIHPRYNATKQWINEFEEVNEEPIIIHYNGPDKPWRYVTERKGEDIWWEYANQTGFENYESNNKDVKDILWVQVRSMLRSFCG